MNQCEIGFFFHSLAVVIPDTRALKVVQGAPVWPDAGSHALWSRAGSCWLLENKDYIFIGWEIVQIVNVAFQK